MHTKIHTQTEKQHTCNPLIMSVVYVFLNYLKLSLLSAVVGLIQPTSGQLYCSCVYYPFICSPYFPVYCKCILKLSFLVSREIRGEHWLSVHTHTKKSYQCCWFYRRGWWRASAWCSVWTAGRCVWCFALVFSILCQLPSVCRPGVLGIHSLRLQPRWALLY